MFRKLPHNINNVEQLFKSEVESSKHIQNSGFRPSKFKTIVLHIHRLCEICKYRCRINNSTEHTASAYSTVEENGNCEIWWFGDPRVAVHFHLDSGCYHNKVAGQSFERRFCMFIKKYFNIHTLRWCVLRNIVPRVCRYLFFFLIKKYILQ